MSDTIFRPYRASDAERSDRSAGDRMRHREKVRESIRENIVDIIAEESIIGRSGDRIIKVPIKGIREYRFVFGENTAGVAQSDGEVAPGDIIEEAHGNDPAGRSGAGDQPGIDYYETDVTLDELVDIMFEDLELPDLERKSLREMQAERQSRRKGYRPVGIRVRLDKRRTVKEKIRRRLASHQNARGEGAVRRFPFHEDDLVFRHRIPDVQRESNAVVFCMMDTSGSMDTMKKYLARSFYFLLCQFVQAKYRNVEIVFLAHETQAKEVTEEEFFSKGESGGTLISSAYEKALEIIAARYHPSLWNIYAFHCSDGDNFDTDNDSALRRARELCDVCNLFGYGEIKPHARYSNESSMMTLFRNLAAPNFLAVRIENKREIYSSFRAFLSKDRVSIENPGD
jgi:sporulation protein YhbH